MITYSPCTTPPPSPSKREMRMLMMRSHLHPHPQQQAYTHHAYTHAHTTARRALTHLGHNESKENLKLAEEILTHAAQTFRKRWNFDPDSFTPISESRDGFQWVKARDSVTSRDLDCAGAKRGQGHGVILDVLSSAASSPASVCVLTSPRKQRSGQVKGHGVRGGLCGGDSNAAAAVSMSAVAAAAITVTPKKSKQCKITGEFF